jgi:hypothetical protein
MPKHAYVFWSLHRGRVKLDLTWHEISRNSVVVITASQGDPPITSPLRPARWVGAANFTVSNVAPRDGGVIFVVNIDWSEPLNLWTYITVFDPNDPQSFGTVPFPPPG